MKCAIWHRNLLDLIRLDSLYFVAYKPCHRKFYLLKFLSHTNHNSSNQAVTTIHQSSHSLNTVILANFASFYLLSAQDAFLFIIYHVNIFIYFHFCEILL